MSDEKQYLEDDVFETEMDPAFEAAMTKEATRVSRGFPQSIDPNAPQTIDSILTERGNRYGKFTDHATITQFLKLGISQSLADRNKVLMADQQEALDMICHKIGRIVNGDPNYADNWIDIAGYAQLVADRLQGNSR